MSDRYLAHSETYKGYTIKIYQDTDPIDPRENDNLGTMVCFHNRHDLGDDHNLNASDFNSDSEIREYLEKEEHAVVVLSLYLYDHGGITISTTPFNDRWDSGLVGFIYISREKVFEEYGWKRITKERREKLVKYLTCEVEEYDDYLTGNVYGYEIEDGDGEELDSCWGFSGDYRKNALVEARSSVDYYAKKRIQKRIEQVKGYIRNKVPLIYRESFRF